MTEIYQARWGIETAFQKLERHLNSEINTLGYPKATLFSFCLALVAFNIYAVVMATLQATHPDKVIKDIVSEYYIAQEIDVAMDGISIAITDDERAVFAKASSSELAWEPRRATGGIMYRKKGSPYWWIAYRDASGRKIEQSTETTDRGKAALIEAEARAAVWTAQHRPPEPISPVIVDPLFDEVLADYLESARLRRDISRDIYAGRNLAKAFAGRAIRAIQPADIRRYLDDRRREGVSDSTLKRELNVLCAACNWARLDAGIEDFHIHDLRHTCAAWLVQAGVPLLEVSQVLRHASIVMTQRYAHLAPENVRAAVATLDIASRSGHADMDERAAKQG